MQPTVFSIQQTAEYLNLPISTVYELVRSKDFHAVKLRKHWRIHRVKLDQWLEKQLEEKRDNL